MQTNFAFLSATPKPSVAPDALLARVTSEGQAVAIAIKSARLKQAYVAAALGISGPYLSLIRHDKRPMPDALVLPLCYLTRTLLVQQYRDLQTALDAIKGKTANAVEAMAAQLRSAA